MSSPRIRFVTNFNLRAYKQRPPLDLALPPGFEWRSCLALVLPKAHSLQPRINTLRKAYDPHYFKFPMPHIKLIYPFIQCFDGEVTNQGTIARIERALKPIEPFTTHLTSLKPFYATMASKLSKPSFSLRPSPTTAPLVGSMQAALRAEFAGEIGSADPKMSNGVVEPNLPVTEEELVNPWDPRMSIGRKADLTAEEAQSRFERGIWGIAPLKAEDQIEAERFGRIWMHAERKREVTAEEKLLRRDYEASAFDWLVDRVSVLYRPKGQDTKFRIVEEIMLGGKGTVKFY